MNFTPETLLIFALLGTPALTSLICIPLRGVQAVRAVTSVNVVGSLLLMILGQCVALLLFTGPPRLELFDLLYFDALSGWLIAITSALGGMAALYSVGYLRHEVEHGAIAASQEHWYYFWFHQAIFTMLLAVSFNNLGLQWASVEGTTLTTAFLVGFYQKKHSLEAAWKYLILCTVGITLALLGVLLAYASAIGALGEASDALNWTVLRDAAPRLDPGLIRLAFVFILIGFGTKAGLAPMHTWLPDAHSQAPTPVSALLSGVLLNCALYGILRYHIIAIDALGPDFSSNLLIGFGLFSIAVAVPFVLVQRDLKRLLAYSSVEHIGIIVLAVGIGGPLGLFGAMLHMLNHSIAKVLLFFTAGNVGRRYGTMQMVRIRGLVQSAPLVGTLLLLGGFAIAGSPPFNIFVSEFTILSAGFEQQLGWVSVLFLVLLALVFAGMLFHLGRIVLGEPWRTRRHRGADGHNNPHEHGRHDAALIHGRVAVEGEGAGKATSRATPSGASKAAAPLSTVFGSLASAGLAGFVTAARAGTTATTRTASMTGTAGMPATANMAGGASMENVEVKKVTRDGQEGETTQTVLANRPPVDSGSLRADHTMLALPALLAIPVIVLGLYLPPPLVEVLDQLAAILQGGR